MAEPMKKALSNSPHMGVVKSTLRAAADMLLAQNNSLDPVAKMAPRALELNTLRMLPRTLMGGTAAMREAGELFMPRHKSESDETFMHRLYGNFLFGAFEQTVKKQSAKLFIEPIVLSSDMTPEIVELAKNIDGQGEAITSFIMNGVEHAMVDGISYVIVDFPKMPDGATLADQLRLKARPYSFVVPAGRVLGWRSESRFGSQALTQFRYLETDEQPDGAFGAKRVERVRVLEAGKWAVYTKQEDASGQLRYVQSDGGTTTLDYVPVIPLYMNKCGFFEGKPPLLALADLCQEHWVSSSEQRYALAFSRFAMLALSGVDADTAVVVGPDKALKLPQGATAGYIEPTGAGISAGRADLQDIEGRMQRAGMEVRVENAGRVTATASAIDSAEANAAMRAVASALQSATTEVLKIMAQMIGKPLTGSVKVYDDFGEGQAPGTLAELMQMRVAGELSRETFYDECKRRGILDESFNAEEEAAKIGREGPPMPQGESGNNEGVPAKPAEKKQPTVQ